MVLVVVVQARQESGSVSNGSCGGSMRWSDSGCFQDKPLGFAYRLNEGDGREEPGMTPRVLALTAVRMEDLFMQQWG